MTLRFVIGAVAALVPAVLLGAGSNHAAETTISLADGKLQLTAPDGWVKKQPKFTDIVQYEFSTPAAEGDKTDGRVTIGPLRGGVEANQQRWLAQFEQPDHSRTADRAKQQTKQIAGHTVQLLDVSGTYLAPRFAPGGGGHLADYRMLVAVIDAGQLGTYYVRFSGPEKTVARHAADFDKMIQSLTAK
jgi:hypothetical protein